MTATATAATSAAQTTAGSLASARFIDLVTFRRTGEPVATPVLFAMDGDRILVRTAHDAGKLKRIAHTSRVELAPADQRGRRLGPVSTGQARVLGPDAVGPALRALHAKYRIAGPLFTAVRHLKGKKNVIIEITLDAAPAPAPTATAHAADSRATALTTAAATVALALAVVACGGGAAAVATDAPATTPAPTAIANDQDTDSGPAAEPAADGLCALIPAERAAAALGEPVGDAHETTNTVFKSRVCRYASLTSDAWISVTEHPRLTRDDFEESATKVGMTKTDALEGIGDAVYLDAGTAKHPRTKLAAFAGGRDVWVVITREGDQAPLLAAARQLAMHLLQSTR